MWVAWKFLNDPAAHTDEVGLGARSMGFVISILGILIMSILIGFIVDMVSAGMEELRKGKSKVNTGHRHPHAVGSPALELPVSLDR